MASNATAHAPLAPPSVCASPSQQQMDGASLQRPFTASGARKTRLLAVQVHWGEHLDRLSRHASLDNALEAIAPSTYIALRASRQHFALPDSHGSNSRKHSHLAPQDDESTVGECYELRSPPFATSRVVERSAHPTWNELLVVSLPIGWKQQDEAATWMLHVDVVGRDPSQQEDSLLATVGLSLESLATEQAPQHLQVELQPLRDQDSSSSVTGERSCIYLSLSETDNLESPHEVTEVTVHELVLASPLMATTVMASAQFLLLVSTAMLPYPPTQLRKIFHNPHDETRRTIVGSVWISPMTRLKSGEKRLQWQFPMIFHLLQATNQTCSTLTSLGIHMFTVSRSIGSDTTPTFTHVASTTVDLLRVQLNGTPAPLEVSLEPTNADSTADPLQLSLTVRRWDGVAWSHFQSTSANRRIITTNRRHRKRAELQALEWTGALCRGLNRYPISSFCDEGGISSLLASYLAASNAGASDQERGEGTHAEAERAAEDPRLPLELLNQHIRLLQQEIMAKHETIQRIQRDVETQKVALQRCGTELIAARNEKRARDARLAQLEAQLRERDERDADQTRDLLAGTGGLTGLRLDSQGTQRMSVLIFKYKELEQRHHATVAELADAKRATGVYEQLEQKYAELEQAHVVQAALVQRLQKDKTHNVDLQKTIRLQEKVIRKFEQAMQHQRQPQHQRQLSQSPAATTAPDSPHGSLSKCTDAALTDSPLQALRAMVLEQQLQANAKSAANEIGRLKMRVMELETQLSHEDGASHEELHNQRRQ